MLTRWGNLFGPEALVTKESLVPNRTKSDLLDRGNCFWTCNDSWALKRSPNTLQSWAAHCLEVHLPKKISRLIEHYNKTNPKPIASTAPCRTTVVMFNWFSMDGGTTTETGCISKSTPSVKSCIWAIRNSNGDGFSTCITASHGSPSTQWKSKNKEHVDAEPSSETKKIFMYVSTISYRSWLDFCGQAACGSIPIGWE